MDTSMQIDTSTKAVIQHHLQAIIEKNLDKLLEDYTEASVFVTPQATFSGLEQIGQAMGPLLASLPEGFNAALKLNRMEVTGELAYLVWQAEPWFPLASDTFVVRDGKIVWHTFVASAPQGS